MRTLVDEVLASGVAATIVAEVAHRTSILPMVLSGFGQAVMPSSWAPSARQAGATVHRIVPESYLHVAAVCRRTHLTPPAQALMDEARQYAGRTPAAWEAPRSGKPAKPVNDSRAHDPCGVEALGIQPRSVPSPESVVSGSGMRLMRNELNSPMRPARIGMSRAICRASGRASVLMRMISS